VQDRLERIEEFQESDTAKVVGNDPLLAAEATGDLLLDG
jgi:hypothetical protein